jgi:RNA polymerase sigma factor (sigma-70 family)
VTSPQYADAADDQPSVDARARWLGECEAARAKVYRALIAMGAPRPDAEDALQDALEAALRAVPGQRPEGWLFVVAMRRWNRLRWRQRIFRPLLSASQPSSVDRDGEIDLLVELAKLPERQRTVLVARHVLGLSQNETASALGIAPGTVGSIGHRAIKALRERLEK